MDSWTFGVFQEIRLQEMTEQTNWRNKEPLRHNTTDQSPTLQPGRLYKRRIGTFLHDRWAPTNSKPDRSYQPTTQSTSDCHVSSQNTPCTTAQLTRSFHQESTPIKVCTAPTVMTPLTTSCYIAHCTTTSEPDWCSLLTHHTTAIMSAMDRRDKIVQILRGGSRNAKVNWYVEHNWPLQSNAILWE